MVIFNSYVKLPEGNEQALDRLIFAGTLRVEQQECEMFAAKMIGTTGRIRKPQHFYWGKHGPFPVDVPIFPKVRSVNTDSLITVKRVSTGLSWCPTVLSEPWKKRGPLSHSIVPLVKRYACCGLQQILRKQAVESTIMKNQQSCIS